MKNEKIVKGPRGESQMGDNGGYTDPKPNDGGEPDGEGECVGPWEILAERLGDVLNKPEVAGAISDFIKAQANNKSREPSVAKTSYVAGLSFSLLIFIGVGVLGWLKIIGPEATTGLIGALIGYWYGREKAASRR